MGETVAEAGWRRQDERCRMPGGRTDLPCHGRSGIRVYHHRFSVVVREWVIAAGLDDPFGNLRRGPCGRDAHALLPQAQVAEDARDHVAVVDQGHDAHLFPALRAEERVGFPDLLDELAPLG